MNKVKIEINKGKASVSNDGGEKKSVNTLLNTEIKLFKKKFGDKEKEKFYSQLGLLLSTSVDIKTAFEIIETDFNVPEHQLLLRQIKEEIIAGNSFWQTLQKRNDIFSDYESYSVKIGEETSTIGPILNELGIYFNNNIKLKRQVVNTLTYPVVVLTLAFFIVYFMLSFVVPMFSDIFTQSGNELPAATKLIIKLSKHSNSFISVLILVIISAVLIHKTQNKNDWYRKLTSGIVLKLPLINDLVTKIYLTRFCQAMKLLSGSKVLIVESLDLIKNMIQFYPLENAISEIKKDVMAGKLLHESMEQQKIFPLKLVALIKVAETVNEPTLIFEKIYRQYSDELENQQSMIGKIIEPFFIIILGLIVGFILIAMYLPLFQLSNGMNVH